MKRGLVIVGVFVLLISFSFVSAVWPFTGNAVGDIYEMDGPTDWEDSDANTDNPDGVNEDVGGILTSALIPYRLDHSDQCSFDGDSVEERYLRIFQKVECTGFFCFLGGGTRTVVDKVEIKKVTKSCDYGCVEVERDFSDISALVSGLKTVGECGSPSVDICDGNVLDSGDNIGNDPAIAGIAILNRGSGDSYEIRPDRESRDGFIEEWYCTAEGELDFVEVECDGVVMFEPTTVTADLIPTDNKQLNQYNVAYCFQHAPTCNVLTTDNGGVSGTGILGPTDVVRVSNRVDGSGIGTREPVSACVSNGGLIGVNSGPGYITYTCGGEDNNEVTPNTVTTCLNGCSVVDGVAGCIGTTCNDPDDEKSGRNSVQRGTTVGGNFQATDVCTKDNEGIEFYCGSATEDFIRYKKFTCSGDTPYCVSGRCSDEEMDVLDDPADVPPVDTPVDASKNLVAHFDFDGKYHDFENGVDGNGIEGQPVGLIPFVEDGISNQGISLRGSEYVRLAGTQDWNFDEFTMSVWIKKDSDIGNYDRIMGKYRWTSSAQSGWAMDVGQVENKRARCYVEGPKGDAVKYLPAKVNAVPMGEWVHLTCTFDGTNLRMYVNGVESGNPVSFSGKTFPVNDYPIKIGDTGKLGEKQNPFKGDLDEVRIYDYALSAEEIGRLIVT
tara:strand:+ start:858 stop:2852 length:1995 start_codon:yes stop_codon:yes gene_type:complete